MEVNIIYGPPGTGKTTTLMNLIEKEITNNIEPWEIAFCSFTRKGTYEGRDRAINKFSLDKKDLPYFRTIHSLAFSSAKITPDGIINKENYKEFSNAIGMNFTGYYTEDLKHNDDRYLFFSSLYRNNQKAADYLLNNLNKEVLQFVLKNYKKYKSTLGIYDYTDLLTLYLKNGNPFPVKIAFVDEAQDLTTLQWAFIWKAFSNCDKIYIAGDDDQAIYQWSGSDIEYFLNLQGNKTVLSKSYRLPKEVFLYSKKITSLIEHRVKKTFTPQKESGSIEIVNTIEEISIDNESTWLFLCRNNYYLHQVETHLKSKGFLYERKNTLSINKNVVKAINLYEKYRRGEKVTEKEKKNFLFYMKSMDQDQDKKPWFNVFTKLTKDTISYYRDIIGNKTDIQNCYIKLSTIHGIKGGEADNVVLLLDYTKAVDENYNFNSDSELRCYYVAVTRAKKKLFLVYPQKNLGYKVFQ